MLLLLDMNFFVNVFVIEKNESYDTIDDDNDDENIRLTRSCTTPSTDDDDNEDKGVNDSTYVGST